ncbi:uclacyanin-2-like [Momordica charantia]|uniref:Uclacyanin-2-like n=1 Tax=Momordica charantia TaxID=3673 RepID=A0A6J1E1K9_MOMCH|nr:uclacyanin-2-like [Momordica charantia]
MAVISHLFVFFATAAIFTPSTLAATYTVGDDAGWNTGVNYTNWAHGKPFNVGDLLLFKYKQGEHNVFKVNGTSFQRCVPPADVEPLTTGNDVIVLTTPGKKWYICGVGLHCDAGQKLVITVLNQEEGASPVSAPPPSTNSLPPSPPPFPLSTPSTPLPANSTNSPPPSAATRAAVSGHVVFLMMAFSVLAGIMIMA